MEEIAMKQKIGLYICTVIITLVLPMTLSACGSQQSLELSGTIESAHIYSCSEVSGKVIKVEKEEGQKVKQGDVLAVLDSGMQELAVKQQEAVVAFKKAKLDELKAGTRPKQLEQAENTAKSSELAAKNARTGVESAQTSYDYWLEKYNNVKKLYDSGTSPQNDLNDAKYKVDTAKQQLEVAKKQLEAAQSQYNSANDQLDLLKEGSTSQTIKAAEADLAQSQAALDQANLTLSRYVVKAPVDGTYILRNVEIGDVVNAGASIGTISDLDNLWTSVYLQQKYLKNISLNQEITLKAGALSGETLKGRITFISSEAEFTPKNIQTDDSKENTVFKVKIKILDKISRLKPGMTVDAIIQLSSSPV